MAAAASPPWKLYQNPHFFNSLDEEPETRSPPHRDSSSSGDELARARAEIDELRAELELHRRMSREAKSLTDSAARKLAEERHAREEAEAEAARWRDAAGRAVREAEEDRRMLKLADAWREERVQMKLAEAAIVLEERMRKIADVDSIAGGGMGRSGRERQGRDRGAKGLAEIRKAVRVPSLGLGKECQRAQLKVMLRETSTVEWEGLVKVFMGSMPAKT